jgi:hypothetical protein
MPIDFNRLKPIGPSRTQPGVINASVEINISGGLIGYLLWVLRPSDWWRSTYLQLIEIDDEFVKKEITRAYTTTRTVEACLKILSDKNLEKDHKDKVVARMGNDEDLWHALTTYLPFLRKHVLLEELEDMREKAAMKEGHYLDLANMLRDTVEGLTTWKITETIYKKDHKELFDVDIERYKEYLQMNSTLNNPIRAM